MRGYLRLLDKGLQREIRLLVEWIGRDGHKCHRKDHRGDGRREAELRSRDSEAEQLIFPTL